MPHTPPVAKGTKHTPLPWETDGETITSVYPVGIYVHAPVAHMRAPSHVANAAFIVRAVNAYEDNQATIAALVEALETAVDWAKLESLHDRPGVAPDWYLEAVEALRLARKEA